MVSCTQVRLPVDVTDQVDEDPSGNRAIWDRGFLNGATQKVNTLLCFVCALMCLCIFIFDEIKNTCIIIFISFPPLSFHFAFLPLLLTCNIQ